ncbi:uncharacterized protein LOC124912414 [Impatiens glandulifera]|uniref:uncharacterized protein LOC124912414 n=1 Tax=Impatiens glandulifera TaxID=253017 RepID=UPI001FB15D3E|nr:uncharacterized protein LOC124912414 [Impatiens glandulifera]
MSIDCSMGSSKFLSWSMFKTHIDQGFLLEPIYKIIITFANLFLLLLGFLVKLIIRFLVDQNDLGYSVDLDPGGFSKTESFRYFFEFQLHEQKQEQQEEDDEEVVFMETRNEIFDILEKPENMDFDVLTISCNEAQFPASHGNETNEQDLIPTFDEDSDLDFLEKISDLVGMEDINKEKTEKKEELGQTDQEISMEGLLDDDDEEEETSCGQDHNPFQKWEEEEEEKSCGQDQNPFEKWEMEIKEDVFEEEQSCGQDENQNPFQKWEFEVENEVFEEEEEDILMEHKELIEQMKMEGKNGRGGGLPTIMEDMEIPLKVDDDFKPLKFEKKKLQYKDHMEEIHKVYRSYLEKMKKLDIFNYQTVQAISFLRMKDPSRHILPYLKSSSSTAFTIKSLISPSRWPFKLQRIYSDPTIKSMAKLNRDLETVYVSQTCLSWEILKWQYQKANNNLLNIDIDNHKTYNQSACEFQQFQVLLQRFLENEPFQGPRIQYYARQSSSIRAILHVPLIKEDCLNEKMKHSGGECSRVCIGKLIDIMEETMRVFWEFIRTDKDMNLNHDQSRVELNNTLQKKNRRLRDIVRSRKCIVKKFQKQKCLEGRLVDCIQLSAQVELKMVGRVLAMSNGLTIDQLAWCQKKLNKVNFINGKIHLEPTFWLFPA